MANLTIEEKEYVVEIANIANELPVNKQERLLYMLQGVKFCMEGANANAEGNNK